MEKNRIFTVSICFILLAFLLSSSSVNAQTYERAWGIGTSIIYTSEVKEKEIILKLNDSQKMEYSFEGSAKLRMNITDIDEDNDFVTLIHKSSAYTDVYDMVFNASYVSNYLAYNLFYFNYYWDSQSSSIIPTSFDMYVYYIVPFIEPNWEVFNKNLKETLNGSNVIDSVNTGTIIEDIYMEDFLNDVSFVINGENTVEEARNSFTGGKSKWKFVFDLSGYIIDRDYNSLLDIYEYFDFSKYEVIFELEYSGGGILEKMSHSRITMITKNNIRYTYEESFSMIAGETGTATMDYNLLSLLLVFVLLPTLIVIKRKRRWFNE
jgi:hypothetical protein